MNDRPKITVFMAVYNGERFLKESIESVLEQTFADFELLIVNDGSTDRSVQIIERYKDPRIRLLHNEKNLGIVETRNRGLKEMRGEYLAILDCDDVAPRQRLKKQLRFLEEHPDFGVVGGRTQLIDKESKPTGTVWKNFYPPEKFPATLLFLDCISNPAVLVRASALPPERYRDFEGASDYDLWQRMVRRWKMWNLPEVMVKYRLHQNNMSVHQKDRQRKLADDVIKEQLSRLEIFPDDEEMIVHRTNYACKQPDVLDFLTKRDTWLQKLKKANDKTKSYEEPIFSQVLADRWLISCAANIQKSGYPTWKKYWRSPLSKASKDVRLLTKLTAGVFLRFKTRNTF